jgi:protein SCO1
MKLKFTLLACCALTFLAVLSALAINRQNPISDLTAASQRTFKVRGVIRELSADGQTVQIRHDEIPGYMPAMVMPFTIKDPVLLKGLSVGDRVQFRFEVTESDSWISQIEKETAASVDSSPREDRLAAAPAQPAERLEIGERIPDVSLLDQDGRPFRFSDFKGKATLITFIYTRCPIPNFCPLMSKNFAALQERLSKDLPGRFQLVSVTIDPEFDRPEILKSYAARYTPNQAGWAFATGAPEQIDEICTALGLSRQAEGGLISHNLSTALIGPDGRLVHIWKSNVWTPFEVHRMMKETLGTQLTRK